MVRLYYCPTGMRGRTADIFGESLKRFKGPVRDFSSVVCIAPNALKARESLGIFHSLAGGTYIPPVMTTLGRLSRSLCQSHSGSLVFPGWLRTPVLMAVSGKGIGHASLLSGLISELKTHLPGKDSSGMAAHLDPLCHSLGIPPEVKERLDDALGVMRRYDEALASSGYMDGDDSLVAALPLAKHLNIGLLIIDGIYDLSPAEKDFARALIERSPETWVLAPVDERCPEAAADFLSFLDGFSPEEHVPECEPPRSELTYRAYPSREEEVEAVARKIKANYVSGHFRDLPGVSVVFSSPPGYADMAERVFAKYGIPCAFPSGGNSLRARRAEGLLSLFACASGDFPSKKLSHLLSSPFFPDIPENLRNWAPRASLSGAHAGLDAWLSLEGAPKEDLKLLNRRLQPVSKAIRRGGGYAALVKAYLGSLRAVGFASEGFDDEFEDRLKWLAFMDSLSGAGPRAAEFMDSLGFVIGSVPREDEGAGVRIMGFPDAWGHEPEHLYFCGLRDGDIPSRPDMDFFLPERLRAELGLRTMKRHLLLEEFNFRRIAGSARNVHLSYPEMEADKVFLPSVFISEGRRVKDPVYGIFSLEEKLVRGGRALYTDSISQIRVRRVFRKGRRFRVTEIDGFRTCPRKFFIEGVAGLRPLEPKRYELDPKTTGTIMHAVMEKLVPFAGLEYPAFRLVARETVEKALRKERVEPYWRDLLGESFLGVLPDIYEIEQDFRKQGFNPAKAEFDIRGDLKGVPLKGKIDRIDARDGAHQIIDYKSGNIDLNPKDILNRGASLQLFLYAALAKQQGFNPDRVGIYSLKETKVRFVPGKDGAKEGRTLGDYVTAALGFLEHTHASLLEGDFRAEPIGDQTCRRCHERPYCPFIHGEAGERG